MSNIVIVGSGPAGVSAALYAVRAGVQTTVLTKGSGALARAEKIENYYGFAQPVSGPEFPGFDPADQVTVHRVAAFPFSGLCCVDHRAAMLLKKIECL